MTKKEKKDEMKNRISMALKDPILQQGFEIICKNLAELEKDNRLLEQRGSDILKELLDKNKRCIKLERQIEKMKCCGNCGNKRCTSKYRGNSAYHTQADGFACAENEDWVMRIKEEIEI